MGRTIDIDQLCRSLAADARKGAFKRIYLLMGEEPYYIDMVCNAVLENCIPEENKDFNEIVCYGSDVNAEAVITTARRYPMFAERQLVVVKEAQAMKDIENLSFYCSEPLDSTVLVICMPGGKADKRRALYKSVQKNGVVVEAERPKEYALPRWIDSFYGDRGLKIAPEANALIVEAIGNDLGKIAVETDKMLKNLPEGTTQVSAEDVEKNIGISRQYSIFELTSKLSLRQSEKALKIAYNIGNQAKFAMPMAAAALFTHFKRILRYHAVKMKDPGASPGVLASAIGASPYFMNEYDAAARNYPLKKCMAVIALLKDYDFKGKGGDTGEATPAELFVELITKILS